MGIPPWLLKTAVMQGLKPENREKILKFFLGIVCVLLLIPAIILLPISFLTGEMITSDYDITASSAYQEIYPVYQEYITQLTEKMNAKAEEVKEEHKRWVEHYSRNPETGERESDGGEWEYPDVTVITPEPPLELLFAYLCQNDENILKSKRYKADKEQIAAFFNSIYEYEITEVSDMDYSVAVKFYDAETAAEKYYPDNQGKKGLYKQSVELIRSFLQSSANGEINSSLNLNEESTDTLQRIFQAFLDRGYSKAAAAGACGNIQQECNFNYRAGSSAHGIIQWTGKRYRSLEAFAKAENYSSWKELDAQISFMFYELEDSYHSRLNRSSSRYANSDTYKKISDPKLAAFVFCSVYEGCEYNPEKGWGKAQGSITGPDGKKWQQLEYRQNYAERIYQAFTGGNSSMGQITNGSSSQKLAALFPQGLPQNSKEAGKYMEKIPIEIWDGSKIVTRNITLHRALKTDIQAIFKDIADAHIKIKSVSGYAWREMNNGGSSRSHHSYGVALDIDPDYNPSGKYSGNPEGKKPDIQCFYYTYPWLPKTQELSISPGSVIVRAFEKRGWVWGAKWGTVSRPNRQPYDSGYHDFMHFSFTGN